MKKETASPPAWGKKLWELDTVTANDSNNGLLNEDLIVWMRTAAFPNFRKLYRKIEKTENSSKLAKGNYKLSIEYSKLDLIIPSYSQRRIGNETYKCVAVLRPLLAIFPTI